MTIGVMFSDIVRSFFKKPFTEHYPFERKDAPDRLRGKFIWNPEKCTGCQLCVKDCPADAIELIVLDKATKRFMMRYHIDRCTFCAQCVESCRQNCIHLSNTEWELASLTKQSFLVEYGRDEDLRFYLEKTAGASPEQQPLAGE